jgi:glycosyltransferase involved in cell wall biosynthesis
MLDAMSCGAFVLGSDTAPVTEIIESGKNGLIVPFFDTPVLTKAIVDQLTSTKQKTIKKAARKLIEKEFNQKYCVNDLLALISRDKKA